ncbi:hypothetical protein [Microbacterium sp. No. 7]|uniref:hypothetical protein n=1 Tax=Microbacterium sp. No. 7 TaxID=1714373 RepID=UPI0006D20298|nr:hypothetical protein [Microbacterium sp. No. 7]ALJ21480.1 glucose-6-phosphate dehydrogenase [Microbacterium sp. No. 7]
MKIRTSADWRDDLPFEVAVPADQVAPGDPARCAACSATTDPLPRDELWVVKHHHPNNPAGFVRLYCAFHRPKPAPAPLSTAAPARRAASSRPSTPRQPKPVVPERPAVMCPDCFVQVPPTGTCGMCGQQVS